MGEACCRPHCLPLEPSAEVDDGGAGAGGEAEEEVDLEEEGEGGEHQEQWDHHQDFAEALRRWKKWQAGACNSGSKKTLADCCCSCSCCCLRDTPSTSPTGECRGVKVERASRASGKQVCRNGNLWKPRTLYRRLCPLQHRWHPRFCCVRPEEPPEERPTHQNWTMCRQLINSPSIISGKVQFYSCWKLW